MTGGRGERGESDVVTATGEDLTKSDLVVASSNSLQTTAVKCPQFVLSLSVSLIVARCTEIHYDRQYNYIEVIIIKIGINVFNSINTVHNTLGSGSSHCMRAQRPFLK